MKERPVCTEQNLYWCILHMNEKLMWIVGRSRIEWQECEQHENFLFYLMFHLLTWNPASFFVPLLRKKREKDVNLKWGLVCGLEAPITWPYSWKFSPSLLQILGWKNFVASSLSIHGPSFFGTTKYHGAIDFSKNEFSLGIFFMT